MRRKNWVNDYLKETNFKIYNQPMDGHCFSALQMAFKKIYNITDAKMLEIVDPLL